MCTLMYEEGLFSPFVFLEHSVWMWLKYSFQLIYMQILETIKYTLSPPANDL